LSRDQPSRPRAAPPAALFTRPPLSTRTGIPRFVPDDGYAESFGEQWNRYRRVQLDSVTGKPLSRTRLFQGTGWPERLEGERVLEVGCGAGRFTEVLLEAGAEVWAVDASSAVEAARANLGDHERLHLAQADLFDLPFEHGSFDRVLCYGVLQHTPNPRRAFLTLCEYGGVIAADVYRRRPYIDRWSAKTFWRLLTTRLPRSAVRRAIEWYVPRWLPIDTRLARVPKLGRFLTAVVPCWNYSGLLPLDRDELRAWAVLDTFDALTPRYDEPQTLESVRAWTREAELEDVEVRYGGNGILINGRRAAGPAS
jgi:SAM-dependent methyltransferase